jgi:AraC family L-rhamnose operon transcriptional activator RhaR
MDQPLLLRSRDYFISPANTVTVEKRESQRPFVVHRHEFDELVIVSAGNGIHIWNDIPYPITCGDVLYINADDRHGYQSTNSLKLCNILYRRDTLALSPTIEHYLPIRTAAESVRFWQIQPSYIHQLTPLIQRLADEARNPDPLSVHYAEALFLQLVILLYRFRHQSDDGRAVAPLHQLDSLLTALHDSVKAPFNLDDFCRRHQTSGRSIHRLFKAQTGMTVSGYLLKLRLCRAMQLLRNSSLPIGLIAAECGYEDSNYFSSAFRKETELSPSQYRARFTAKKPRAVLPESRP